MFNKSYLYTNIISLFTSDWFAELIEKIRNNNSHDISNKPIHAFYLISFLSLKNLVSLERIWSKGINGFLYIKIIYFKVGENYEKKR